MAFGRQNVGTKENPIWVQRGASAYDIANAKAAAREQEVRGLLDQVVETYAPGGAYLKGAEAMLGREKQKYLGSATQQLISSGLYGTTMAAGLPKKWEEEVGMPSRLKLEDIRTQAYTGALGQKASFIESISEQVPSYETIAGLTSQAAAAPQQTLNSWLAETFGRVPNAATPKADVSKQQARASLAEDDRRRAAYLAQLRAQYGTAGVAS